jgi:hypothetical protein
MKLDRNMNADGQGKYALLLLRKLELYRPSAPFEPSAVLDAIALLESEGIIDWGSAETESEFFVIRLKDRNARHALLGYSDSARSRDPEFALEVARLAARAGEQSPFCKDPD